MVLELLACLCACSAMCVLFKRGGGERRLRRILAFAALSSSALLVLCSFLLSSPSEQERLEQFVAVNCSENPKHGPVGVATRHQWFHAVGYSLDDLRIHWAFPQHPNAEDTTTSLRREFDQKAWKAVGGKYAHRIFGYLLPPITGVYFFQVSLSEMSARGSAEFWLSPTTSPSQALLLGYAAVTMKNHFSDNVISKGVFLQSCAVYYFEFLEQAYSGRSVAEVKWKTPGLWRYKSIPNSAIADVGGQRSEFTSTQLPSISLQRNKRSNFVGDTVLAVQEVKVLPECQYKSKMDYAHDLKQYWGHKELVWSHLYPTVDSGTKPVLKTFASNILRMYTEAFNKTKQRGVVKGIRYMDTTPNVRNRYLDHLDSHRPAGTRILLEMDIKLDGNNGVNHTSEYVYLASGSQTLCHTSNFQWKRNVDVHIVVSVKNLGLWVQHLIHNMEHVYKVTKDEHFQLIIVDYGSEDLDIEGELRASSLPRWKVIRLSGGFSRSGGLQAGIDYVTDPDSIVMTVDMHLTLPPGFVEYTRRHVVKGKMGFAPMFYRLNEGHTEMSRRGFWETLTYGLLGMYKSDWVATGGFDTQTYTTTWGGEDWDAVDRIRSHGLELFRVGYPGLVHYFHTKKGMWGHR